MSNHLKLHGVDKALYRIDALKNGKVISSKEVIAYTKLEAYYYAKPELPEHDNFDYTHLRWTTMYEPLGIFNL